MGDINLLGKSQKNEKEKTKKESKVIEMTDPKKEKKDSHYEKKTKDEAKVKVAKPSAFDKLFGSKKIDSKTDLEKGSAPKMTAPKKEVLDTLYKEAGIQDEKSVEIPSVEDNKVFTPNKILEGTKKNSQVALSGKEKNDQKVSWFQRVFSRKKKSSAEKKGVVSKKNSEEVTGKGLPDEILRSLEEKNDSLPNITPPIVPSKKFYSGNSSSNKNTPFLDDGLDVNLVPDSFVRQPKERMRSLTYVSVASILVVLVIYGGFIVYETVLGRTSDNVAEDIREIDSQILGYQKVQLEAKEVKDHMDATEYLLDTHVYWSRFLFYLEQYTLEDVYYLEISGDAGGRVSLRGVANNYQDIGRQLLQFEQADDFLSSVTIREGSVYEETVVSGESDLETVDTKVTFEVDLTVLSEVFYFSSDMQ